MLHTGNWFGTYWVSLYKLWVSPHALYGMECPPYISNPSCCTVEKAFYGPRSFISRCTVCTLLHSSQVLTVPFQIVYAQASATFLGLSQLRLHLGVTNTAVKRTAHEYKFELPVNYAFPATY